MADSPFDHPYPPSSAMKRGGEGNALANLVPTGDASSGPSPPSNDEPHRPASPTKGVRRVQWPADLPDHVSIAMASPTSNPKTLEDHGAQDALTRALEEHSLKGPDDNFPQRYAGSEVASEGTSRAGSSDGDHEERMADMREEMMVFVDPGETDGLPTLNARGAEGKNKKAAWNLVKAYTSGNFLRQRKNAGFKGGRGNGVVEKDKHVVSPGSEKDVGGEDGEEKSPGFFHTAARERNENVGGDPSRMGFASGTTQGAGGILSALMALQNQQQQPQTPSGTTSAATSPGSSIAASRRPSMGDSSDEEEEELERMRFTIKQREKRATKNSFHGATSVMADVGKNLATGVVGGAGHVLLGAGHAIAGGLVGSHHGRLSPNPNSPDPGSSSPGHARPAKNTALNAFITSRTTALPKKDGSTSTPPSPGIGQPSHPKRGFLDGTVSGIKKVGGKLVGLEPARPEAARSSAGVFGGLMLSTGNIAGVATPAATKLAVDATRPGYRLSRYSAPDINPTSVPARRPRSLGSGEHTRAPSLDGTTPSPQLKASSTGENSANRSPPGSGLSTPPISVLKSKPGFSLNFKDLPLPSKSFAFGSHSRQSSVDNLALNSPRRESHIGDYFLGHKESQEQRETREWEKEKRRRRKVKEKRKQEQVFITLHVAAILARQEFIMKLARSFMMFGAPSHRLEAQIQATARVLEINCQVVYIPGVMLMSFGDTATHTSEIKFLKQANGLDLGKLLAAYYVYYKVIYDQISVLDASTQLDELMVAPPKYKLWQQLIIGGLASALIQPSAFYGSFIDCLVSIPLGALLVLVQVGVSRNDLYSSLFEIVIATINAFLAAALASTRQFCFAAVASGSVVLILPGYIVLCGSLELANRSIISGSVRLVFSILYSLFLGFGLAMGSEVYQRVTGLPISGATDYTCASLRVNAPWYRATIPPYFFFLTIPAYLLMLGLRNGQPLWRRETVIMLMIGSAGFTGNYFSGRAFPNRADISSAIGSFVVGLLGNVYGKFTRGSPFVVMVVGVLLQLPSGLSNGGLLQFASDNSGNSSTAVASVTASSYSAGFTTAESLVEVAIGLTVGLFVSAAIVNFLGGGRRRGSNLSSF